MAEKSFTSSEFDTSAIIKAQNSFFESGATLDISKRIKKLKALESLIQKREKDISQALYNDFQKPEFETVVTETSFILSELKYIIKNLEKWAKPKRVKSPLLNFPSRDFIYSEPYGTCLVLAPWNYPFQLKVSPAIGAIAAGNTVVLKPSEYSPYTSEIVEEIFACFCIPKAAGGKVGLCFFHRKCAGRQDRQQSYRAKSHTCHS